MTEMTQDARRLEHAATLIIEQLTPDRRNLAIEMADLQYHIPRWHIVAGCINRLIEEGRLADYVVDPGWSVLRNEPEASSCEYAGCGKLFDPVRLGQRFCSEQCAQYHNHPELLKEAEKVDHGLTTTDAPSDASSDVDRAEVSELQQLLKKSAEISLDEITHGA